MSSVRFESKRGSSCDGGGTGEELRARFLFLRGIGVLTVCDPLHISCSSGEATYFGACLAESSMLPTRSASGSRVVAGVDGGGHDLVVGGLGVFSVFPRSLTILEIFGVSIAMALSNVVGWFSLSASRSFGVSPGCAPSMNWKALSFVRVCVDGMIGGPATTCRGGGAG